MKNKRIELPTYITGIEFPMNSFLGDMSLTLSDLRIYHECEIAKRIESAFAMSDEGIPVTVVIELPESKEEKKERIMRLLERVERGEFLGNRTKEASEAIKLLKEL